MHLPSFSSVDFLMLRPFCAGGSGRAAVLIPQCLHLLVQLRQPSFEDLKFLLWTPARGHPRMVITHPQIHWIWKKMLLQWPRGATWWSVGSLWVQTHSDQQFRQTFFICTFQIDRLLCDIIVRISFVLMLECNPVGKQLYYHYILFSHSISSISLNYHLSPQQILH